MTKKKYPYPYSISMFEHNFSRKLFRIRNDSVPSPSRRKVYIDFAPSSSARCAKCHKRIIQGSPRVWKYEGQVESKIKKTSIKIKKRYCYKCGLGLLQGGKNHYNAIVIDYTKIIKRFKRMSAGKRAARSLQAMEIVNKLEEKNEFNN